MPWKNAQGVTRNFFYAEQVYDGLEERGKLRDKDARQRAATRYMDGSQLAWSHAAGEWEYTIPLGWDWNGPPKAAR